MTLIHATQYFCVTPAAGPLPVGQPTCLRRVLGVLSPIFFADLLRRRVPHDGGPALLRPVHVCVFRAVHVVVEKVEDLIPGKFLLFKFRVHGGVKFDVHSGNLVEHKECLCGT